MPLVAVEPADLLGRPANEAIVEELARSASPQRGPDRPPWVVGGYAVVAHPEVVERIVAIGALLPRELTARVVYGSPCLIDDDGEIVAVGRGMRDLMLRLDPGVVAASGLEATPESRLDGWCRVSIWPAGLRGQAAVERLGVLCLLASRP